MRSVLESIAVFFRRRVARKTKAKAGTILYPKPGFVWNPLKKHRNIPCPCHSGRKAKHCCGRIEALPEAVAEAIKVAIERKR